ncbi:hypothetical protein [uncultured Roseovarius sp.]|uniref:hypothetical protein n=1 Tax=uncultured Roseovarius sp. TaxID=293344 RepID=UPI00261C94A6|nr:hypothetical protein [uncultured Roseovarius sp.]
MGLRNIVKRLDKYQQRLDEGKAEKIKAHHVEKAIEKLAAKEVELTEELGSAEKPEKRARLEEKLSTIRAQIEKARWLSQEI